MASKTFNFRLIRIFQKTLTNSLLTRLLAVRYIFDSYKLIPDLTFVSSKDKFYLALNLKYSRYFKNANSLYFLKKRGFSLFFRSLDIYESCFRCLWNIACLPFVETLSDRFSYAFRPYRNSSDILNQIKNIFKSKKKEDLHSLNIQLSFSWNLKNKIWALQNFPLERKILLSWFNSDKFLRNNSTFERFNNFLYTNNSSFILFNYLINGLENFIYNNLHYFKLAKFKLIRYFDNVFIFTTFPNFVEDYRILIKKFFDLRGICFNEKIFIFRSEYKDFNFLDWNISTIFTSLLFINVNRNILREHKIKIKKIIKNSINTNIVITLKKINFEVFSFTNKYVLSDSWFDISNELDLYLNKTLWKFVKKYHLRRNSNWIYSKYWKCFSGIWKFSVYDFNNGKFYFLTSYKRSIMPSYFLPLSLNVFNLYNYEKFTNLIYKKYNCEFTGVFSVIYNRQKGLCIYCKQNLLYETSKLFILKSTFNKKLNSISNLYLSHSYCG